MPSYVMDMLSSFTQRQDNVVPLAAYADATSLVLDVRAQRDKVVVIKNLGANTLNYTILGSIDSPKEETGQTVEYDLIEVGDTAVLAGQIGSRAFSNYYTYIKISVKAAAATTATIKVAGYGN